MSSATPVAGTPGAVSAESLLEKYNLPEGTNADAIARVMARLGDLPVSSAEKKHGDPAVGDPRGARSGGAQVDASARRNQMRFASGGEPVARVSWSPASPGGTARESNGRRAGPDSPTTPGDPLALIQDLYGDDVDDTVRASARRALTAAGYGSPVAARASPGPASSAGRASASRLARPGSGSAARPPLRIVKTPPPATKGKYVKIKFCTQLPTPYPQFAFFCNLPQYVKDPYKRFLENKIRENFDFTGVPMTVFMRKK